MLEAWLRPGCVATAILILFCSLTLVIVLLPAFEHSQTGEMLLAVVSMLIIVVSVVVSGHSRLLFWIAFVLGGPAVALRSGCRRRPRRSCRQFL